MNPHIEQLLIQGKALFSGTAHAANAIKYYGIVPAYLFQYLFQLDPSLECCTRIYFSYYLCIGEYGQDVPNLAFYVL
jgi:hypothetical protein